MLVFYDLHTLLAQPLCPSVLSECLIHSCLVNAVVGVFCVVTGSRSSSAKKPDGIKESTDSSATIEEDDTRSTLIIDTLPITRAISTVYWTHALSQ